MVSLRTLRIGILYVVLGLIALAFGGYLAFLYSYATSDTPPLDKIENSLVTNELRQKVFNFLRSENKPCASVLFVSADLQHLGFDKRYVVTCEGGKRYGITVRKERYELFYY